MHYDEIKQLIDLFEHTDLTELELTRDNTGLRLTRGVSGQGVVSQTAPETPAASAPSLSELQNIIATVQNGAMEAMAGESSQVEGAAVPAAEKKGTLVTAPIVGTFYAGSAPDKPPYVKVGDTIGEGDTLCIIEAMKFMNEVPSTASGTVSEILVQDGDFVEFGQALFRIV
jgi:acetyl-CoA carboxylase biotin carboxyl carrier protein